MRSKMLKNIWNGTLNVCSVITNGLLFYANLLLKFINKFIKSKRLESLCKDISLSQNSVVPSLVLISLFVLTLFASSVTFFNNKLSSSLREEFNGIKNVYEDIRKINANNIEMDTLYKENSDTVFWMSISDTNVNYPIVQYNDNEYYKNHDYFNNYSNKGWLYMDYQNKFNLTDKNTVIYGDSELIDFKKIISNDWFKNSNRTIVVKNSDGKHVYEVYSVYYTIENTKYFDSRFKYNDFYQEFLDNTVSLSKNDFNRKVGLNDSILTLVCDISEGTRGVVHAKLIG